MTSKLLRRISPMLEHEGATEVLHYAPEPWVLRQCIESGLEYLENPPDYEAFVEDFAWDQTYRKTAEERREAEPLLYGLNSMVKRFRHRILKRNKVKSLTCSLIKEIGMQVKFLLFSHSALLQQIPGLLITQCGETVSRPS